MDDEMIKSAERIISRRLFRNAKQVPERLSRNRLRAIGDEIGEPIIPDEGDIPKNFLRISLPNAGPTIRVAMPRSAVEKILALT